MHMHVHMHVHVQRPRARMKVARRRRKEHAHTAILARVDGRGQTLPAHVLLRRLPPPEVVAYQQHQLARAVRLGALGKHRVHAIGVARLKPLGLVVEAVGCRVVRVQYVREHATPPQTRRRRLPEELKLLRGSPPLLEQVVDAVDHDRLKAHAAEQRGRGRRVAKGVELPAYPHFHTKRGAQPLVAFRHGIDHGAHCRERLIVLHPATTRKLESSRVNQIVHNSPLVGFQLFVVPREEARLGPHESAVPITCECLDRVVKDGPHVLLVVAIRRVEPARISVRMWHQMDGDRSCGPCAATHSRSLAACCN